MAKILLRSIAFLALAFPALAAGEHVVDPGGFLSLGRKLEIEKIAADYETRKGVHIAVVVTDARKPGTADPGDGILLVVDPAARQGKLVFAPPFREKIYTFDANRIGALAVTPPNKDFDSGHYVKEAVENIIVVLDFGPGSFSQTFLAKPVGLNSVQRSRLAEWGMWVPFSGAILVFVLALLLSRQRRVPPGIATIAVVNLVPLVGVVAFDWSVVTVLLLFWFENVVIIVIAAARLALARPDDLALWGRKLAAVPSFLVIGLFGIGHLIAIIGIFLPGNFHTLDKAGDLYAGAFALVGTFGLEVPFVVIALVHLATFLGGYVLGGEYRREDAGEYGYVFSRLATMHVTLIFGGMAAQWLGSPVWALVVLVVVKVAFETATSLANARGPLTASVAPRHERDFQENV